MVLRVMAGNDEDSVWQTWNVDRPGPILQASVMTFQADGKELQVILQALQGVSKKERGF